MRSSNNGDGRSRKGNAHCLFPYALFAPLPRFSDAFPAFFPRLSDARCVLLFDTCRARSLVHPPQFSTLPMFFILTPPRFLRFPNDGRPRKDPARAPVRLFPQKCRPRTIARTPRARAAFSEIRGRTLRDKNGGAPTFPPMLPKCPHSARSAPFASRRILLFGRTARGDAGFFAPYAHMPARTDVK